MSTGISVRDAMVTRVVTGRADQTVQEGAEIMRREDVGSLIICEGSSLLGIITREDIVNKIVSKDTKASEIKLNEIMNSPVVTVLPEDDLADAARKMTRYGFERLPVVEADKLIGIISDREIAKVAPAAIEILRERLLIEEPTRFEETTSGDCELCGNFSEELFNVNSRWACPTCREEAEEL